MCAKHDFQQLQSHCRNIIWLNLIGVHGDLLWMLLSGLIEEEDAVPACILLQEVRKITVPYVVLKQRKHFVAGLDDKN